MPIRLGFLNEMVDVAEYFAEYLLRQKDADAGFWYARALQLNDRPIRSR